MSAASLADFAFWRDRRGAFSWLRAATFVLLMLPAAQLAARAALGTLGAEPIQAIINGTGTWGIRILVLALAVTPLARLWRRPRLVIVRRMIGVVAFAYLATHFVFFWWSHAFDAAKVASEIALRFYLTVGFVTLLGLAALAATSTDAMTKRLGGRAWRRLHRTVYGLALGGLLHYFLQARLQDYIDPVIVAGMLIFLFALRWLVPKRGAIGAGRAIALAIFSVVATGLGEALFLNLWIGADMLRVLEAQIDTGAGTRPAWIVAAFVLPVALATFWFARDEDSARATSRDASSTRTGDARAKAR